MPFLLRPVQLRNVAHRLPPRKPEFLMESLQCSERIECSNKSVHFSEPISTTAMIEKCENNIHLKAIGNYSNIRLPKELIKSKKLTKQKESVKDFVLLPPSAFTENIENNEPPNFSGELGIKASDFNHCAQLDTNRTQFSELSVCSADDINTQEEIEFITNKIRNFKKLKDNLK